MWLPMTTEEYKIKMNTMSPTPCRGGVVGRTPWDGEHSTMESRSNEFIQTHTREYFDKPKRRENEGVPKVRELYSMNDRQCGWSDEPNQSVGFRRTFLDWVSDPKEQQKPSWWRQTVRTGASCNAPPLTEDDVEFSPTLSKPALEQSVLERLAQMPASQSSEFWRGWAEHGIPKKAIPEALLKGKSAKQVAELTKTISTAPAAATVLPPSPKGSSKPKVFKIGDKEMPEWDDRWYITHSKDNERLCKGHAQYFSSAQFLNGSEVGHPGSYLGLPSMKWRKLAKTVSHFPVGADGRLSVGRTSMLV